MYYDFLIIGGGVIGLSIARELRKLNAGSIAVIDSGSMGREASWAAAGMLAPNAETEIVDAFYQLCSASNDLYAAFAEDLLAETGIDIAFSPSGTLELAFDEKTAEHLNAKLSAQNDAGVGVEKLSASEVRELEPGISESVLFGLHYPKDGHVDNRLLVGSLTEFARLSKIDLIENEAVTALVNDGGTITGARTTSRTISAGNTIVTTGAWTSLIEIDGRTLPIQVKPVRGQMIALQASDISLSKVIYGAGAYLVPRSDGRILVGATMENAGFDRELSVDAAKQLRAAAIATFPELSKLETVEHWCGFRPFAEGGTPVIGNVAGYERLTVATGHYRNGILLAPLTARIVSQAIVGNIAFPVEFAPDAATATADSAA